MKRTNELPFSLPRIAVGLSCLIGFIGSPAAGADYTLTIVAKTGDTIGGKTLSGILGRPTINNRGTVMFTGLFPGGSGVFTQSELLVKSGDRIGGRTLMDAAGGLINESGRIAFGCRFADAAGICSQSELLVRIGDAIGGKTVTGIVGGGGFNDNGTVSFLGTFSGTVPPPSLPLGIFTQSDLLVKVGDTISGETLTFINGGTINNDGTVAFLGAFRQTIGIFTQSGLLVRSGDTIGGERVLLAFPPLINNGGVVAFDCELPIGGGICTTSELLVKAGDTVSGKKLDQIFDLLAMNDKGTVVFLACVAGAEFPCETPVISTQSDLVVKFGDTIAGKTLDFAFETAINNRGAVVMMGQFSDGTQGIILAVARGAR